jgi:ribosomal protein S18 acetylase RimI-like enzyme
MYDRLDSSSRTMGLPPISTDEIRAWIERLDEDGWNLLALDDGTAVGHVGVVPPDGGGDGDGDGDGGAPRFVIFVHQAYQGRGIGTELVKQVVAYAADREYGELLLSVSEENERAIDVYEGVGFEIDDDSEGPANVVGMSLPLSHPIADRVRLPPAER